METTLKQRLIGAVVLIALAIIFVPMILDGPDPQDSTVVEMEVPVAPKFSFESELPDPAPLDNLPEAEGSPAEDKVAESSQAAQAVAEDGAAESSSEPDTGQAPPAKEPVAKAVKPQQKQLALEVVEAAANHIEPDPSLSAWAVQVAAFAEKDKALALQEKLIAKKYTVFTERFENEGTVLYRVKAGPELKRENAERLRDKFVNDHGLQGAFVTSHP